MRFIVVVDGKVVVVESQVDFFASNVIRLKILISLFSPSPTHRLTKVRRVEFELAACDVIACPDHPEKQWLALEVIANHLGSSLQEFTIHLVRCGFPRHLDGPVKDTKWVKSFAEEKSRMGTNICIVWRQVEDEMLRLHPEHRLAAFDYYWPAQRSDTSAQRVGFFQYRVGSGIGQNTG